LPGTANVPNGFNFGHAALVTQGYSHPNTDTLLMNIAIIESIAADVPQAFQVREGQGLNYHWNKAFRCTNFSNMFSGNRYLLRPQISEEEIDSIIAFARQQKGDWSSWHATKGSSHSFDEPDTTKTNWADNHHWYCSLLVWQAFKYVTGIDLDVNSGYQVYPNDLIANPYFDNTSEIISRYRF
jgi:hypothetical protein